ncbi:MAG: hypothetical protein IKI29_04220 [Clostridia bacterium]|nr:hypothetical protein [Clostridia bacterium]
MENTVQQYFLAANSCRGFYSAFEENYSVTDGWRVTLVKGGPGTGKSSFMRHLAAHGIERGEETVLGACSSDPQSLDAVIFPRQKKMILDATAPHTVEPRCVGVCENLVDLGAFWSQDKLFRHRAEILTEAAENQLYHKTASRYLAAAGQFLSDRRKIVSSAMEDGKIAAYANRLAKQYLPPLRGVSVGREWGRFLTGVTPKWIVSYPRTVTEHFEQVIVIADPVGCVSGEIMARLREKALSSGYEIITVSSPFFPDQQIDHLLIPSLSLAFVTESDFLHFGTEARRIHDRRFLRAAALHPHRQRLIADKRLSRDLLQGCCENLALAKQSHDRLESHYIAAMDFAKLTEFAEDFAAKFF